MPIALQPKSECLSLIRARVLTFHRNYSPPPRQVSLSAPSIQARDGYFSPGLFVEGMNLRSEPSIPRGEERDSIVSPGTRKYSTQELGAAMSILSDINDSQFGDLSDSASPCFPFHLISRLHVS